MKKIFSLFLLVFLSITLTWCFDHQEEVVVWEVDTNNEYKDKFLTAFWTEPFWNIEISWWIARLSSPMFETDYSAPVNIWKEWENYYFSWEELDWEFIKKDCVDWWKWDLHYYTVAVAKFREYYYEGCWDDEEGIKMSDEEYEKTLDNNDSSSSVDLSWIEEFVKNCEAYTPYWVDRSDTVEDISFVWNSKQNIWKSYKIWWLINYTADWAYRTDSVSCVFTTDDFDGEDYYWYLRYDYEYNSKERQECVNWLDVYDPEWMAWDPQTVITVWCWPENYWEKYITWYLYTTTYPDLWLRITTPTWFDTFFKKSEKPIFTRDWNRISVNWEYLQVFDKKESENLLDLIKKKHLNKWCVANEYNYYSQQMISADYPWTIIYDIFDETWMMPWECLPDDEQHEWEWDWKTVFYFESKDKTKYYKLVRGDWCAPWPCSMFWEIEIF